MIHDVIVSLADLIAVVIMIALVTVRLLAFVLAALVIVIATLSFIYRRKRS